MPKLVLDIRLDPVPGWGNKIEDFVELANAGHGIPEHYISSVEVLPEVKPQHLFALTFDVAGEAAIYERAVQVLASSEAEAKEKVEHHYQNTGAITFTMASEVIGKAAEGIFGLPLLTKTR